jgi:peptidoglycan/LPS O-acetylase OafA/YrhL
MNVFVTDHPLSSDSPRRHKWIASVLVIAALLCPFLLGLFWLMNGIGTDYMTHYESPDPFWEVLLGAVFYSLVIALAGLGLYRFTACVLRKILQRQASKVAPLPCQARQ